LEHGVRVVVALGGRSGVGAREAYKRCVDIAKGDYVEECRRMVR